MPSAEPRTRRYDSGHGHETTVRPAASGPSVPSCWTLRYTGWGEVLRLCGDLDLQSGPGLIALLQRRHAAGVLHVVLEMSAVHRCDAHGLAAVVAARRDLVAGGGSLLLTSPSAPLRRELSLRGLADIVVEQRRAEPGGSGTWRDSAACRTADPELFFPIGTGDVALAQERAALVVCRRCPVREECLQQALSAGINDGVWGGTGEAERRRMLRRRGRGTRTRAGMSSGSGDRAG